MLLKNIRRPCSALLTHSRSIVKPSKLQSATLRWRTILSDLLTGLTVGRLPSVIFVEES